MTVRFLHLPKTAGTTFLSVLRRQYWRHPKFALTGNLRLDRARFSALPSGVQQRVRLVTGHAPLTTGLRMVDEAETLTFVRDPVGRVKSFCQQESISAGAVSPRQFRTRRLSPQRKLGTVEPADQVARQRGRLEFAHGNSSRRALRRTGIRYPCTLSPSPRFRHSGGV